jgi:hypothetical protein
MVKRPLAEWHSPDCRGLWTYDSFEELFRKLHSIIAQDSHTLVASPYDCRIGEQEKPTSSQRRSPLSHQAILFFSSSKGTQGCFSTLFSTKHEKTEWYCDVNGPDDADLSVAAVLACAQLSGEGISRWWVVYSLGDEWVPSFGASGCERIDRRQVGFLQ